jgi:nucleoside-diphosphate-sugar epimerase
VIGRGLVPRLVGAGHAVTGMTRTAAGARRIVAQSIAWVYAPGDDPADGQVPLDLDAQEPRRTTVLGIAALEDAVQELPEWVVLRYGLLYGPGTFFARARLDPAPSDVARGLYGVSCHAMWICTSSATLPRIV